MHTRPVRGDGLCAWIKGGASGGLAGAFEKGIPKEIQPLTLLFLTRSTRTPKSQPFSFASGSYLDWKILPEQEARGNQAVTDFTSYLKDLVAQRRKRPGDPEHDVLTRLIQGEGNAEPLSEAELLHNCIFILNAGHETTTNLIGNALVALQDWPEQLHKLLSNSQLPPQCIIAPEAYLTTSVDEFLRFEPSNQLGNRRTLHACNIGGVDLPAGSLITLCIAAANRDPAVFEQPDVLNIERRNNKHLAFGFGIHQCAGLSLARLEGRIAIGRFVQRFPAYRLTSAPVRGGRARFRGFLKAPFTTQQHAASSDIARA